MFTFNISGAPTLKLVSLFGIERDKFYLTASQQQVILCESRDGSYIVFDLVRGEITNYCDGDINELTVNFEGSAMVFPSELVKVSLNLSINGGSNVSI